ncbi:hypothetical protein ACWJJH_02530 [Endozoicomonadaceae bacterium StTr2]
MRTILIFSLLVFGETTALAHKTIQLNHRQCDEYSRHQHDYKRLSLASGAKQKTVCINYQTPQAGEFESLPLFDSSGGFKYRKAGLISISTEDTGACFRFAGLDSSDFEIWIRRFIADHSDITADDYVISFKQNPVIK